MVLRLNSIETVDDLTDSWIAMNWMEERYIMHCIIVTMKPPTKMDLRKGRGHG